MEKRQDRGIPQWKATRAEDYLSPMKSALIVQNIVCALLFPATSCDSVAVPPEVDVAIENKSSRIIENVRARFGDYQCSWGLVSSGAKKIYGGYAHPITSQAELHWESAGEHKVHKFDLRTTYPEGKSGRLSFVVYDDRAEVSFRASPPSK